MPNYVYIYVCVLLLIEDKKKMSKTQKNGEGASAIGAGRNQPLYVGVGKFIFSWFLTNWRMLVNMVKLLEQVEHLYG